MSDIKHIGNLMCVEIFYCDDCPIRMVCNGDCSDFETLYEILNNINLKKDDNIIYNILKSRLDEEVEVLENE